MVKAIRASVLILLLACSAQAGYMGNGSPEPPPPPPAPAVQQTATTNGEMPNDAAATITEAALTVLNTVLALL
jgi:hypothetical protein